MNRLLLLVFLFLGISSSFGQVTIAINSFETTGDTWTPPSFSVPPCTDGADRWDYSTALSVITPSDGSRFWGVQDLNGNCGGTGFETITLPNINVSTFTGVTWSMDYYAIGYESNDDIKYELFYDNLSQGEVVLVDGMNGGGVSTGGWQTETIAIPGTVTNVSVILSIRQNGGSDFGGLDNVFLEGMNTGPVITASPLFISGLDYVAGNGPSNFQSFSVGATSLSAFDDITIAAPANYEISTTSGGGYVSSFTIPSDAAGTIANQNVYVRLVAGLVAANYGTPSVAITGTGATPVNIDVEGEVTEPAVSFSLVSSTISETGINATILVTSDIAGSHTVDLGIAGGTAIAGNEYDDPSQTLNFTGVTSNSVMVTINDDAICIGDVNALFELSNPVDCSIGVNNQHDLTITDNEQTLTNIDFQGFEGSGWAFATSPAAYMMSGDIWDVVNIIGSINPSSGSSFWGIRDIDNDLFGGDHKLNFTKDITSFSDVVISFDFNSFGFDGGDDLFYQLIYDGVPQTLSGSLTDGSPLGWNTQTLNIPNSVSIVGLELIGNQNGQDDYAGFDNVSIVGLGCNTCVEPLTNSSFLPGSPSTVTTTTATVDWDNTGDGDNSLLMMRQGTGLVSNPIDLSSYNANPIFSTGDQVGSNDYVVYSGSANTATVTGLEPGTEYAVEVYDFNCLPGSGSENYLTTPVDLDVFVTLPERPDELVASCVTNSTTTLQWPVPPAPGNFDGYMIIARQGGAPSATLDNNEPNSYTPNLSWPLAEVYNAGTDSRVLYRGPNNTVSVTDLPMGQNFTFFVYTYVYTTDGLEYEYSATRQTTQTIEQLNVISAQGTPGNGSASLTWNVPGIFCADNILIVANETSGIGFTPSGTTYTGNPVYSAVDQVIFFDIATNFVTVSGLTNGTTYYFEIFVLNGTEWSSGIEVAVTPTAATILERGDMAIVGVNASAAGSIDDLYLMFFKEMTTNSSIDITDNGYERINAGQWGDTEGVIRCTYVGLTPIPAGEFIRIIVPPNSASNLDLFVIEMDCMDVTSDWVVSSLNGNNNFGLVVTNSLVGDQIWILQGGNWVPGAGAHQANYTGNILYGWTASGWEPGPNYASTSGSTIPPGLDCFTTDLGFAAAGSRGKYDGLATPTDQRSWIGRINDSDNWTIYANDASFNNPPAPDFCNQFSITSSGFADGTWIGSESDNWFDCNNWGDLEVPDQSTQVFINPGMPHDPSIGPFAAFAADFGGIAEALDMDITGTLTLVDAGDLDIYGNLEIQNTGILSAPINADIEVLGNFEIFESPGTLDMNSVNESTFTLHGNWTVETDGSATSGFLHNNSQVIFAGSGTQEIYNTTGVEIFHDVTLNKMAGSKVELTACDMELDNGGILQFGTGGFIDAISDSRKVSITNPFFGAITGHEAFNATGIYDNLNPKYVEGELERDVTAGSYDFPIGDRPSVMSYNPVNLNATGGGTGTVSAIFNPTDPGFMDVYDNTLMCGGIQRILNYDAFANFGFWNLNGPATLSYTITLHPNQMTNAPLAPSLTNEYKLMKAPGGTAGPAVEWPSSIAYTSGDLCAVTDYYAASGSFTGFSDFAIMGDVIDAMVVLPIELIDFSVKNQERDIMINWSTATEIENDYFNVYHSRDGVNWEIIDHQNGAGNSQEIINYSTLHKNPTVGIHYYQLQQVDFNGEYSFSDIEVAEIGFDSDVIVYPIPAAQHLFVEPNDILDERSIRIFNEQGQSIGNWTYDNGVLNIDKLAPGVYFISFTSLSDSVIKKFIKSGTE